MLLTMMHATDKIIYNIQQQCGQHVHSLQVTGVRAATNCLRWAADRHTESVVNACQAGQRPTLSRQQSSRSLAIGKAVFDAMFAASAGAGGGITCHVMLNIQQHM
jgi:hypothetical protein